MATATSWTDVYAIFKAYPSVIKINHDGEEPCCYDASYNLVTIDQTLVDAARTELDKTKYQIDRVSVASTVHYPNISTQLDQLYHDMTDGKLGAGATTGSWYVGITSVKIAHPKP